MRFTVGAITQCAGGNHRHIPVTVGQVTRTLTVTREDMAIEREDAEELIVNRIRSALKEGGATLGLGSWNNILSGQEFQV